MRVDSERTPSDLLELLDQIRSRSIAIKQREVKRALTKLEAHDLLTDEQAEVIEAMADEIITAMLAPPERALYRAIKQEDAVALNTARRLVASKPRNND